MTQCTTSTAVITATAASNASAVLICGLITKHPPVTVVPRSTRCMWSRPPSRCCNRGSAATQRSARRSSSRLPSWSSRQWAVLLLQQLQARNVLEDLIVAGQRDLVTYRRRGDPPVTVMNLVAQAMTVPAARLAQGRTNRDQVVVGHHDRSDLTEPCLHPLCPGRSPTRLQASVPQFAHRSERHD